MTLLGFAIGQAPPAPPVNLSLDELIAARRKEAKKSAKTVSNADRAVGTAQAKRDAKMKARRGLATTDKASHMEVEKQVQKQHATTVAKKAAAAAKQKQTKAPPAERAQNRRNKREITQEAKKNANTKKANNNKSKTPTSTVNTAQLARPPSKKAIKAAVKAMEEKGFQMPANMQMVISFAPKPTPAAATPTVSNKSNNNQQQTNNARGRGGGAGRGGAAGAGGRGKKKA